MTQGLGSEPAESGGGRIPAEQIAEGLSRAGAWPVYESLVRLRRDNPEDLTVRGYVEVVRNVIVREFLSQAGGFEAVPKLSNDFLVDYGRFNLNAQEGYLVSLIDGRLSLQKLMRLSPLDPYTTVFYLAHLRHQGAILL